MRALGRRLLVHRGLGVRFAITGADQCVASLSNFAVGVAIARVAGIAALGAYSLAYVFWLAFADFHRALIVEPMTIDNDARGPEAPAYIGTGLAAEVALGAALAVPVAGAGLALLVCGQHAYGVAFVTLAPCLVFLLVQDYWRWVGFMKAMPAKALVNDVVFDVIQGAAFGALFAIGVRSSVLAICSWGLGALVAALFGLWQHSVTPTWRGGVARMRERWWMSRWLLAASLTSWGASQAYVVLTGIILGPVGIGGLRAAQSLVSGPSLVLLQAGGSVGLPEASRALAERGWMGLRRVGRAVTAVGAIGVAAVAVVVLLFGRRLLVLLYGPPFARFATTADLLALSMVIGTLSLGAVLCLKTTKLTGPLFRRSLLSLVVSIAAVGVLVPLFGVVGAAGAAVARVTAMSSSTLVLHWRRSRSAAEAVSKRPPEPSLRFGASPGLAPPSGASSPDGPGTTSAPPGWRVEGGRGVDAEDPADTRGGRSGTAYQRVLGGLQRE